MSHYRKLWGCLQPHNSRKYRFQVTKKEFSLILSYLELNFKPWVEKIKLDFLTYQDRKIYFVEFKGAFLKAKELENIILKFKRRLKR